VIVTVGLCVLAFLCGVVSHVARAGALVDVLLADVRRPDDEREAP
jgi:hypothetical protein